MTSTRHPSVLWAQRDKFVILTVDLHDAQDAKIDLKEKSIDFSNSTDGSVYEFHLDFYAEIDVDGSKKSATGRSVTMILTKKKEEWWPRLTDSKSKPNFVKTDFDRWVDSDESDQEEPSLPGMDFSQFGMPGMGGMGGMGGMPGMGGMGGMPGMPDMANLANMANMPDLSNMPNFDDQSMDADDDSSGDEDDADAAKK